MEKKKEKNKPTDQKKSAIKGRKKRTRLPGAGMKPILTKLIKNKYAMLKERFKKNNKQCEGSNETE